MSHTIHCDRALLENGWDRDVLVTVDDSGLIVGVTRAPAESADEQLSGLVIPGMPNLHSHGFQALMRGLSGRRSPSGDSFWSWREHMYRLAARLDPDQLRATMGLLYAEMLESGYTSCAEFHYLHHAPDGGAYDDPASMSHAVIDAAQAAGIGLTHLPVLYTRSGFGAAEVNPGQIRFRHTVDSFMDLLQAVRARAVESPLVVAGIAPHSLRAVSRVQLDALLPEARGMPVHLHIAEQPLEVAECEANLGARPLTWLLDHCPVGPDWCLVHATHITSAEAQRASVTLAVAGLCPTTEADLGDGIFSADAWIPQGGRFGVGSDSNLRVSPREELRLLEFTQRLASGGRNLLADAERSCGRFLYERAATGGAQALGQPVGRIAVGCRADLVELDRAHPLLQRLDGDACLDTYIFGGDRDMIRSVRVAGRLRVEGGRHLERDELAPAGQRVMAELRG